MNKWPIIPGEPNIVLSALSVRDQKECTLDYEINTSLHPGEAVLLTVPEKYQSRILDLITLSHRKAGGSIIAGSWDPEPAYSRVLVLDKQTMAWTYWGTRHFNVVSFGDKLAETRSPDNPEVESLHDWIAYSGLIHPLAICIINSGRGEGAVSYVQSLSVDFFPDETSPKQVFIFSPGTVFSDLKKKSKEQFGGGESFKGQYPHAVALNFKGQPSFPFSTDGDCYYTKDNSIHIVVDHTYTFSRIEVAVGDTKDTGKFNVDGYIGTPGGAKLDIELQKKEERQILAKGLNVPPQGVLKASPKQRLTVSNGDEFIISVENDPAYIMGVRIQ